MLLAERLVRKSEAKKRKKITLFSNTIPDPLPTP